MKNATRFLFLPALLLASCSSAPRPEIKIAAALRSFQDNSAAFTAARRKIVQQHQNTLNTIVERAARTREEVERKQGTWRVQQDKDRLELFDNLLSEAKGAAESLEALARIQAAHEQSASMTDAKAALDRNTLASMIKDLYVMGGEGPADERFEQYFQYLTAVGKQIAAKKPDGAP